MHDYKFCLPQSKPVHEESCCMAAENSITSSELVEAVLSPLPTVGHGMGLDRDYHAIGCTAFAVKDPHCPHDSVVQEIDLFSDES